MCSAEEVGLNHRAVAKLAVGFKAAGVPHKEAAGVLSGATAQLLWQQLQVGGPQREEERKAIGARRNLVRSGYTELKRM